MDDLIAFLKARLDEDEQAARRIKATRHGALIVSPGDGESPSVIAVEGDKLLRDVEAKRRILAECVPSKVGGPVLELSDALGGLVLELLALPYADHPDYQESWKP